MSAVPGRLISSRFACQVLSQHGISDLMHMEVLCVKILTLIPEANSFGLITLILLCLSSSSIASFVHMRYLSTYNVDIVFSNTLVKFLIVIYGLLIIPLSLLFHATWFNLIISIPAGVIIGLVTVQLDRKVIRYFFRKRNFVQGYNDQPTGSDPTTVRTYSRRMNIAGNDNVNKKSQLMNNKLTRFSEHNPLKDYGLVSVIGVAIFEEIIFRGFLIGLCLAIPSLLMQTITISLLVLFFAVIHVDLGWEQVLAKTILGVTTTLLRLIFGNLYAPIIAHVVLNAIAYFEYKKVMASTKIPQQKQTVRYFENWNVR